MRRPAASHGRTEDISPEPKASREAVATGVCVSLCVSLGVEHQEDAARAPLAPWHGVEPQVITTGVITSPFWQAVKEGKEKIPPCTPLKEKAQEKLPSARARGMVFTKPTVEDVAALTAEV